MKKKPIAMLFIVTVMLLKNGVLFAQCELPIPQGSHNLCNPNIETSISNTSNTITINNVGVIPAAGSCSITINYFDEETGTCAPLISCSTASLSTLGSTVSLSLSGCAILPDLLNTAIFYLNIQMPDGLYFYHVFNYGCAYALGENLSNSKEEKITAVNIREIKIPKVWNLNRR